MSGEHTAGIFSMLVHRVVEVADCPAGCGSRVEMEVAYKVSLPEATFNSQGMNHAGATVEPIDSQTLAHECEASGRPRRQRNVIRYGQRPRRMAQATPYDED